MSIRNAAPRPILNGVNDASGRQPVLEPEQVPTHLPHTFLFTERGPTLPQLVIGDKRTQTYGSRSFDERGPYTNHQTMLSNIINGQGNQQMIQRLVPPGANPPSAIRLSVEVIQRQEPVHERDLTGKFRLNNSGDRIPTGDTVQTTVLRWLLDPILDEEQDGRGVSLEELPLGNASQLVNPNFGQGNSLAGTMSDNSGNESTIYPIMDIEAADFGSFGDLLGFKLSAPTSESSIPIDVDVVEDQQAYLFRMAFVERDKRSSTAKVLETLRGDKFVDFSFREGVISEATNTEYHIDEAVIPAFEQEAAGGNEEIRSPIGRIHHYQEFLEIVLDACRQTENQASGSYAQEDQRWLINPLSGHDYNNRPYWAIRVLGPTEDGILLNGNATHYLQGGYDGIMTFDTFDAAVAHQLNNYGDLEAKMLDDAVYPVSAIYDSGFSMETKKSIFVPMGRRKDIAVTISTQDVSRAQNTPSEDSSTAIALRAAGRAYPESEVYGTSVCRAIVVSGSGYLLNSGYKKLLPLTIELASKAASYMGAGNGVWKTNRAFDEPPNNRVTMFKGTNAEWQSHSARIKDWDNGLVWAQSYDRRSLFFPGIQTIYDDDSSVVNSAITMYGIVDLEKVAQSVWRDLTGISSLSPEQFVERSNRLIRERTRGRYDGRFDIEPDTQLTAADTQRGYSWTCDIILTADNMRTVGSFTIIPTRRGG